MSIELKMIYALNEYNELIDAATYREKKPSRVFCHVCYAHIHEAREVYYKDGFFVHD